MGFKVYDESQLPEGFIYPPEFLRIVASLAFDTLYPWWFIDAPSEPGRLMLSFVAERGLVPFAKTDLYDDIACFDGSDGSGDPKIEIICSTPEVTYSYPSFSEWLAMAKSDAELTE